jgi:UDP-GlcNAc:undecaprenyl-phosphate GlcNAc-1-phosphate transferase
VLGVPLVDTAWAIIRRLAHGESPFRADRKHFHHLLLDAGLNQRQAVLVLYTIVALFGVVALMAGSMLKLVALLVLVALMSLAIVVLVRRQRLNVVR